MGYLDVYARRRIAVLLFLVAVAIIVLAGANIGPFADEPTEADRAQAALEDFFAAARTKNWDRVCDLLSPPQRKRIEAVADECPQAVEATEGGALARSTLQIRDVRVSGALAAIDATIRIEGIRGPQSRTFKLEELDGNWVIADLGV